MQQSIETGPRVRRTLLAFAPALFALVLITAVGVYAWSVLDTSRGPQDWMLIIPGALVCITALLWAAVSDTVNELLVRKQRLRANSSLLPLGLLLLICLYAPATAVIGFDVATAIFIGTTLILQGERRPIPLLLSTLGGTALLIWIFTGPLAVRLPTMLI